MQLSPHAAGAHLSNDRDRPALSSDVVLRLRDGISTCKSTRGLSFQARVVIAEICRSAHTCGWSAEQLIIAVKEACYASPEIAHLHTASEREAMLATVVTGCIREYYERRAD